MQNFINSLSVTQWAFIIGATTWAIHTIIDRNQNLSRGVNYFIVRFTTIVIPVATAFATDPNISGLVHNYFPALAVYFTTYQGLYTFIGALAEKIAAIKSEIDSGIVPTDVVAADQTV